MKTEVCMKKLDAGLSQSEMAWTLLKNAIGNYYGTGTSHGGQQYETFCHLISEIPNKLILVKTQSKNTKGEIFHDELSWIGRDILGSLSLYVNSNNHAGITPHYFNRLEESKDGNR